MAILFLEDWKKYPDAVPHLGTKNKSFLDLAKFYHDIGVQNFLFPLALHNPNLRTVDPFSPDLTDLQIKMMTIEMQENPWYFMREILRATPHGGSGTVPFRGNRSNVGMWWAFFAHLDMITTQPRQTGKSYGCYGLTTYLLFVVGNNLHMNLLTKDNKLRLEAVEKIKELVDNLPWWMQIRKPDDKDNREEISVNSLGNTYKTHVPNASVTVAMNIGRGMASPVWHIDEPPFQLNIQHSLPALIGSMGGAIKSSKEFGSPYGRIYTTTAGRQNTPEGAFFYDRVKRAAVWDEKAMLDCKDEEALHKLVESRSADGTLDVYAVYSHRQLGFDDKWLMDQIKAIGFSPENREKINMDYFNIWVSGSDSAAFSPDIARNIGLLKAEPLYVERQKYDGLEIKWYIEKDQIDLYMSTKQSVVGLDTSDAAGGDSMGFVLVDIETFKVIATLNTNFINTFLFSKFLTEFLVKYENTTMIIERRSSGATIMDHLLVMLPTFGINPFTRLFNRVVNESDEHRERFEAIRYLKTVDDATLLENKKEFGFPTSGAGRYGRSVLYGNNLQISLEKGHDRLTDIKLSLQLLGLRVKNGRLDHADNSNDDLVIAWLLATWFLQNAVNLDFYGINPVQIYAAGNIINKKLTEEEEREYHRQEFLKKRLIALFSELENCDNDILAQKFEQEIRVIASKINLEDKVIHSIDQLVDQANQNRRNRLIMSYKAAGIDFNYLDLME